jgi:UDP-N-acetylmuramoylalanine--D-glutamate ligase
MLAFKNQWGEHNLKNLLAATAVALCMEVDPETIKREVSSLPVAKFREEKVFENEILTIYNDTTATSPEATIVAVERFLSPNQNLILIAGGTDRELDFTKWSTDLKKYLDQINLILLSGSATEKMKKALGLESYEEYDSLEECVEFALEKAKSLEGKSVILFSPGAKSFEKFKNEFDRGEQFNDIVKKLP